MKNNELKGVIGGVVVGVAVALWAAGVLVLVTGVSWEWRPIAGMMLLSALPGGFIGFMFSDDLDHEAKDGG